MLAELLTATPWLQIGAHDHLCRMSDDAFDALVAALTARAAALGLTLRPDPELQHTAGREGWIALPIAPLTALALEAVFLDPRTRIPSSLPNTYAYRNIRHTRARARRTSLPWGWLAIPGYAAGQ